MSSAWLRQGLDSKFSGQRFSPGTQEDKPEGAGQEIESLPAALSPALEKRLLSMSTDRWGSLQTLSSSHCRKHTDKACAYEAGV